jgi:hypothetical protein
MTEWIVVNGARIERDFFDENLADAKRKTWALQTVSDRDHHHCAICSAAISSGVGDGPAYASNDGWLCDFCYDRFLKV